jgi:hypothetical protein
VAARVEVRSARGPIGRARFVDVPFRLFGADPAWVPPLRISVKDRLSPRHPANTHQETALWVAFRDGRPVGRVGACVDRLYNEFHGSATAFVGFFECADDPEAARRLFEQAAAFARSRGATECLGPASFTTNDEIGLLVEGFEHPPLVLTPHNPPYYERLWRQAGWEPAMDLWAWRFDRERIAALSDRQRGVLERLRSRSGLRLRTARMAEFDAEVRRFFDVYRAAWARNWGFAPLTEAEVRHLARDLKRIVDPELALFVEDGSGQVVAAALALPDLNQAAARLRSGRLLPLGWLRLLLGLRRVDRARILLLGIRPEHQSLAVGPLMYAEFIDRLQNSPRWQLVEASWILATNRPMNAAIEATGGRRYKTWRVYRLSL